MNKKFLGLLSFLALILCFGFASPVLAADASLDVFTVDNTIIAPGDTSGSVATTSSIDTRFTAQVDSVSIDVVDNVGNLVKNLYTETNKINPDPKVWDGKNESDNFVIDGTYIVQVVYSDAGGTATETLSIVVDKDVPIVGEIVITPSYATGGVTYIGTSSSLSLPVNDLGTGVKDCNFGFATTGVDYWPDVVVPISGNCVLNNVDTSDPAITKIVAQAYDNFLHSQAQNKDVTVDSVAPVITLLGESTVEITAGSTYTEAGATANDSIEGDLSSSIVTTGTVDTATVGTYTLSYNVTDSLGNVATEVTRTVNVIAAPSSSSGPTGYVQGFSPVFLTTNKATTTGKVLGVSTTKERKLTKEELRQRILKKRLNRIKIKIYDLKHPQVVQNLVINNTPKTTTTAEEIGGKSTSTTGSTTPKKSFWKFW